MARIHIRTGGGGRSLPGRIFLSLFLLVFLAAGCYMAWVLAQGLAGWVDRLGWEEARCRITDSRVRTLGESDASSEPYRFVVAYRYEWQGVEYAGDVYRTGYTGSSDPEDAYELEARYPVGAEVDCRVDPDEPTRSALRPESPWTFLALLFPLVFVAAGGGGLYFVWRPKRDAAMAPRSAGDNVGGRGPGCLVAFFAVFAAAGLFFFVPFFALPAYHNWQARSWPTVPCNVVSSQVGSHQGDDSTTYSVDVVFRYRVDGREYTSTRYDFMGGSSSGYDSKRKIVDSLPAGTETTCRYDPEAPYRAVMSIAWRGEWWVALIPLVFVLVGVGGMAISAFAWAASKRRAAAGVAEWLPARAVKSEAEAPATGPMVLESKISPLGKLAVITGVCLFWNGIVSVFVWQVYKSWRSGGGVDGCLVAFLVPFVLVGLVLLVSVPYTFLAMFNPRPVLTLERRRVEVGDRVRVSWRFRGSPGRIRRLRIVCEGREEATYRRGTDTHTDRETFAEIVVVESEIASQIATGSADLEIPVATMHSFEASHNKIVWGLKVEGVIDRWPDVGEELPLVVEPRRVES